MISFLNFATNQIRKNYTRSEYLTSCNNIHLFFNNKKWAGLIYPIISEIRLPELNARSVCNKAHQVHDLIMVARLTWEVGMAQEGHEETLLEMLPPGLQVTSAATPGRSSGAAMLSRGHHR